MDRAHREHLSSYVDTPGCFQKGDTNSERAELERQEGCLETQASVVRHYLAHGTVAPPPPNAEFLVIGVIATLEDEYGRKKDWLIVGHEETDIRSVPNRLAYTSPLLDGLYGCRTGACNERVDVLCIRVPRSAPRARAA